MSRRIPYLLRRGDTLSFRIAVPADLRAHVGREITKSLQTQDSSLARPKALEYAAVALRLFAELRTQMAAPDPEKLKAVVKEAKLKIRISDLAEQHDQKISELRRQHAQELKVATLKAENEALKGALASSVAPAASIPVAASKTAPAARKLPSTPMLGAVINGFLDRYPQVKKSSMFKKHKQVLPMLIDVIGDKPITELKQADINDFFDLLGNLPPRWKDQCRKKKLNVRELGELEHPITIGPKAFDDTYIASIRPFLKAAKKDWQDQGFPLGLTTDGIEYLGDREENENRQRAFTLPELRRLFEGPELAAYACDGQRAHCFWLPHIGLFTGARVNEICQLNPQTDILQDSESGVWHFLITEETPADDGIVKSVKTGDTRKVPIHSKLIELGILDYVERVKRQKARRLFPAWLPTNKRASGEAEKWFRQLLRDTKLRDETPKAKILGMHAFRHTLLTYGAMQKPPLSLFCITGHAQDEFPISASGAGKGYLTLSLLSPLSDRATLLNQLDYGLVFHKPKST